MCDKCRNIQEHVKHVESMHHELAAHISGLVDALFTGTNQPFEYSVPILIGGPQGVYTCVSPFASSSQWKVDQSSSGNSVSTILVSDTRKEINSLPDYTGTQNIVFTENPSMNGLSLILASNVTEPVDSEWYNVTDSKNTIYITIKTTTAAFVNLCFRQKRIVR